MIKLSFSLPSNTNTADLNAITRKLAAKDPSLWGAAAANEAAIRLDWVDLPQESRELLPTLDALSAWSRELGHENFILCGMGGSSLAPEVIAAHYKKKLIVLDSTEPSQVAQALQINLAKSCVIVASKSGSTIETASQKALFESAFKEAGLDLKNHMVIITDPDSPLHKSALSQGLRTVIANPKVGGRFSALSAFGLTPAALIGVDVSLLLDDASDAAQTFSKPDSAPVQVAAMLAEKRFEFARFFDGDSPYPGLADWIEQLVAESTGKDGKGILPIVLNRAPKSRADVITFKESDPLAIIGTLGAQFIFWEWVTALLCYLLKVDPFNQPNVAESKERTGALLSNWKNYSESVGHRLGDLEIFSNSRAESLDDYLRELKTGKYLAVMAYLNRETDSQIVEIRESLESRLGIPTTFGWGPRFLHSTGQFHKGGPLVGTFLQITSDSHIELKIPGAGYGFERLVLAQALGDNEALASRGLKVIRIHLKERRAGINQLISAIAEV
ncbi:MAG: hypothetical protein ACO23Q_02590 [Candidatus Nanopelagicaceae bacterium]